MPLFTWRWSCGESHRHRISILGSSPTRLQCKQTEIKPSPTHSRTVRGQAPSRAVSGCACLHGLCQQSTISIRLFFWGGGPCSASYLVLCVFWRSCTDVDHLLRDKAYTRRRRRTSTPESARSSRREKSSSQSRKDAREGGRPRSPRPFNHDQDYKSLMMIY